jgi:Domain of unknown function (DUF1929)
MLAALAAALLSVLAAPAAAHVGERAVNRPTAAPVRSQPAVDASEVAQLGRVHALEHARTRAVQRAARGRWRRLTSGQRTQRIAAARSETAELNRALAQRSRDDVGYWQPSLYPLPEYAIHAVMLPTGKVLMFGREPFVGPRRSNRGSATLFDPATGATEHVPPPPVPYNLDDNGNAMPVALFCAGQAILSDGRVLVAGGNLAGGRRPDAGIKGTFIFDPWTKTWQIGPQMSRGRWYPTLTKLTGGDILIAGGFDEGGTGDINPHLDIYRPGADPSTALVPFPAGRRGWDPNEPSLPPDAQITLSLYPSLFLLPNANLSLSGPARHDNAILDSAIAQNRSAPMGSAWRQIQGSSASHQHYGGAPLLDPDLNAFEGSWDLLSIGGRADEGRDPTLANRVVDRLRAGPGAPVWSHDSRQDMNQSRYYLGVVTLPDGGVVAVGGGLGASGREGNYYVGASPPELRQVELRRPGERTWRLGAAQEELRTYHSTALLLPDGRVLSAGDDGHEGPLGAPVPPEVRRDSAEIYWPPYLFDGDSCALRPVIRGVGATSGPGSEGAPWATLTYGEQFGIFSEDAQPGMRAVLAAPAAVTHNVDSNQRVVPMRLASIVASGGLNAMTPATAAIAPPGYYLLFVVDAAGTPSRARWVRLLPASDPAVVARGSAPAPVAGPWPTPRGRSCLNVDGSTRSEPDPPPPTAPPPAPPPLGPASSPAKLTAKLGLQRAAIVRGRRELNVQAAISARASGRVRIELQAAGRRTRMSARVDSAHRRVRLRRKISAAQARSATGILTISYPGDADTRSQSVRLRVAARPARLTVSRPTLTAAGRLRAAGTTSSRARGVVRVQLQYEFGGRTITIERGAKIGKGRWKLDTMLAAAQREQIAGRTGSVHSYTLYTGYRRARISGEMRSLQVLGDP